MVGIIWLAAFVMAGELMAEGLLRGRPVMIRAWIGAVMGLVMAMWLPALCAFVMRFTVAAQWTALGIGMAGSLAVWRFARPRGRTPAAPVAPVAPAAPVAPVAPAAPAAPAAPDETPPWQAVLAVVLPLIVIGAYLQYTHNLRPVDGAYNVGQSTYSDINLHLSIVTGLRDAAFPPEYIILPGTRLCYPFLMDSLSGSMYLLGTALPVTLWLPGILMMLLVFVGYCCLSWQLTGRAWMMMLCVLFLFVNGGFGFFNMIDMVIKDPSAFGEIFTGYYMTPTNLPDLNLRWSNILVDMLVPQRTFLAGWTVLIPVMYLLIDAIRSHRREAFALTGALAGCMPMINTHAFLALGLASLGFMAWELTGCARAARAARSDKRAHAEAMRAFTSKLCDYLIYGGIAVALALPQILTWTINQATEGGFIKLHFNWVNNDGGTLIDEYFWFWIKNIGPAALFIIPALVDSKREQRMIAVGAFTIFAVAETIVFQPLVYDNNKLYYVWYMLMLPVVMRYIERIGAGMRKMQMRGAPLLMALFVFTGLLSGSLTIGRELVSDYQLYSAVEVTAMEFVDENAPRDAVFLTAGQHNNAVSTLAGRKLVCGSDTFLYFHGLNYGQQKADAAQMFLDPAGSAELFEAYQVDYIYVSAQERSRMTLDEATIAALYPLWYSLGDINIYAVSERAQAQCVG